MSMDVQIKNFQKVKNAELNFIPGLNVILGPSNNGKSSILKGIKALLYTTPGTSFIRQGQTSYVVGMKYNGHIVLLQKGIKESIYMVDGEKYTKFGTTTPEAVIKATNIKELEFNGQKEGLNFWDQMDYPFLLDKTAVELFRFIIDSGDNDKVSNVLKRMVSDRQSISKDINTLQGELNVLDLDIQKYKEDLDKAKPIIEASEGIVKLQPKVARYKQLVELKSKLNTLEEDKNKLNLKVLKLKDQLTLIKDISGRINALSDKTKVLSSHYVTLSVIIGKLSDIKPSIINVIKIKDIQVDVDNSKIVVLNNIKLTLDGIKSKISSIHLVKLPEVNVDNSKVLELRKIKSSIDNIRGQINSISIVRLPEIDSILSLQDKKETLKSLYTTHLDLDHRLVEAETSKIVSKKSVDLLDECLSVFDICPLCGQPMHNI